MSMKQKNMKNDFNHQNSFSAKLQNQSHHDHESNLKISQISLVSQDQNYPQKNSKSHAVNQIL